MKLYKRLLNNWKIISLSFITICFFSYYSYIPEPRSDFIELRAINKEHKEISNFRIRICLGQNGVYVSLLYNLNTDLHLLTGGVTQKNNLEDIYLIEPTVQTVYADLIDLDKLGSPLNRDIWMNWIQNDEIIFPSNIKGTKEIVLKFKPLNFNRLLFLSFIIDKSPRKGMSYVDVQTMDEYSAIVIPSNIHYTEGGKKFFFEMEENLNATFEIKKNRWPDKFDISLLAVGLAVVFFLWSLSFTRSSEKKVIEFLRKTEEFIRTYLYTNNEKIDKLDKE